MKPANIAYTFQCYKIHIGVLCIISTTTTKINHGTKKAGKYL